MVWMRSYVIVVSISKGLFNLSNQLSNFSKNWEVQPGKPEFVSFTS